MLDTNMPLWVQIIQIIGWVEMGCLFILLPFERKHEYIYKMEKYFPDNPLFLLVVVGYATPIAFAGIFAILSYFVFFFLLWVLTK